jgi:hypothetical protein
LRHLVEVANIAKAAVNQNLTAIPPLESRLHQALTEVD